MSKTKIEILDKKDMWVVNGVPFNVSFTDTLDAMDEYAKQESIDFCNWQVESGFYRPLGTTGWEWAGNEKQYSPEQLYNLYLQSKQK